MSFLQGSVTYTRFGVLGPKPRAFTNEHLDRLRDRAADRPRAPKPADGVAIGWTGGSHIWDNDFSEEKNVFPDHLAFDFRVFTNKIPADQFKASYESRVTSMVKHSGKGPTAKQKRQAKEEAAEEMEAAAADGRFKKWKTVPVLWDAVRNEVFIGCTSNAVLEKFAFLFAETFSANLFEAKNFADKLRPRTAATLAVEINKEAKNAVFSKFLVDGPEEVRWSTFDDTPDFLGNEFLLWLWHTADSDTDTITVQDETEITFMFSGGIRLDHPTEKDNDTINAGSAVRKPQAFQAIRSGYLPRKAALTIVHHGDQFSFKFNAETMQVSGARLPKPDDKITGTRPRLEDRLTNFRGMVEAVDLLYAHFIERRLSSYWLHDLADMKEWLSRRAQVA